MARRGKAASAAVETEETDVPYTNEGSDTMTAVNETNGLVAAAAAAAHEAYPGPGDDALPLEIPEEDLQEAFFNNVMVNAVMTKPRFELAKPNDWWGRPDRDTYAFMCDFIVRADQPDNPKIAELAGMRLGFNRFPIVPGQGSQEIWNRLAAAFGQSNRRPDFSALDNVAVVIKVWSKAGEDKETGAPTGRIFHRVNQILRDLEYEKAHGGGQ